MSQADNKQVTCRKCKLSFIPSFTFDFYRDGKDPEVGLCENCMISEALAPKKPNSDPSPLPAGYDATVCKFGKGQETCSFLGMSGNGLRCLKGSPLESNIIQRRREDSMGAKGDNCSGPPDFQKTKRSK